MMIRKAPQECTLFPWCHVRSKGSPWETLWPATDYASHSLPLWTVGNSLDWSLPPGSPTHLSLAGSNDSGQPTALPGVHQQEDDIMALDELLQLPHILAGLLQGDAGEVHRVPGHGDACVEPPGILGRQGDGNASGAKARHMLGTHLPSWQCTHVLACNEKALRAR